jgi:hypothetical protein
MRSSRFNNGASSFSAGTLLFSRDHHPRRLPVDDALTCQPMPKDEHFVSYTTDSLPLNLSPRLRVPGGSEIADPSVISLYVALFLAKETFGCRMKVPSWGSSTVRCPLYS